MTAPPRTRSADSPRELTSPALDTKRKGEPAPVPTDEPAGGWRPGSAELLLILLIATLVLRGPLTGWFDGPKMQTWATVFLGLVVQAMPFLVFGVVISALISVFVPPSFFQRVLPRKPGLAVPVAGIAGIALPGCECGSVPIAGGLMRRGVAPAAALAFLLSAPAINPVVMVATAVAFPGKPEMVVARVVASVIAAVVMGWLWLALGRSEWIRLPKRPNMDGASRLSALGLTIRHDFINAGGFLVLGGVAAATLKVIVPVQWLNVFADNPWLGVLGLAVLAVLLSLCSEADAFVAASLSQFSLTARLAFLVVGPMIDLKLFAMQVGTFGRNFALRFAPATFAVAVGASVLVGWLLL